jgi:hypothetical protein
MFLTFQAHEEALFAASFSSRQMRHILFLSLCRDLEQCPQVDTAVFRSDFIQLVVRRPKKCHALHLLLM